MSKKHFYCEVTVVERRILKVQCSANALPTPEEMKSMIENEEIDDVTDEETIEIMSVDSVALIEDDGDEPEDD